MKQVAFASVAPQTPGESDREKLEAIDQKIRKQAVAFLTLIEELYPELSS